MRFDHSTSLLSPNIHSARYSEKLDNSTSIHNEALRHSPNQRLSNTYTSTGALIGTGNTPSTQGINLTTTPVKTLKTFQPTTTPGNTVTTN